MQSNFRKISTRRGRRGSCILLCLLVVAAGCSSSKKQPAPGNVAVTSDISGAFQQPSPATDPKDGRRLALAYSEGSQRSGCGLALSDDGGKTWKSRLLIGPNADVALPEGFTKCFEARTAYTADGALYYVLQAAKAGDNPYSHILLMKSTDRGGTFAAPRELDPNVPSFPGGRGGGDWFPRIVTEPNGPGLYLSWVRFGARARPGATMAAYSSDGETFAAPTRVSPSEQTSNYAPSVSLGGDGTVYVSWIDIAQWREACDFDTQTASCGKPVSLYVAASKDGAKTFAPPTLVDATINYGCPGPDQPSTGKSYCDGLHGDTAPAEFPVVAGSTPGAVYLAWWDGDPQAPARISFSVSTDQGANWSAGRAIGVPSGGEVDQQHKPAMSVAPNGRLDVAFYNVSPGGQQDVYLTSSKDKGVTFTTPRKVTDQPSDVSVGPIAGDGFHVGFGGWLGLTSSNDLSYLAWTDSRRGTKDNGNQGIFFATSRH